MERGAVVDGRFAVEQLAGKGGMGAVYCAVDQASGRRVALKVLATRDGDTGRFAREARVLAALDHPAIVGYIADGVTAGGEPYLAMEWLEGEDLGERLKRGPLAPDDALVLARRLAEGLSVAHRSGVVHRDIKPSNVFLQGADPARPKLLDFGIARLGRMSPMTRTGMMMGTPGYMAPEQARGAADLDGRADVYSLGCVLYECLAGRPPFVGENLVAVLARILLDDTPRLAEVTSGLPASLDDLLARMMARDPNDRPRDPIAVIAELDALPSGRQTPRPVRSRAAVTGDEQRFVCVLATTPGGATPDMSRTLRAADVEVELDAVLAIAASQGGRVERLADGTVFAVLAGTGAAIDQALCAGRAALELRGALPKRPVVLAMGRGILGDRLPVGDAVDRAARLLGAARARPGEILIDDVTAGFLEGRFALAREGRAAVLVRERDQEHGRTLLGRDTPFVGRDRELASLEAVFDECVEEPSARVVVVTAQAGVGKSRLRHELGRRLEARGTVELWLGRGDPMSAGSPFAMLAAALRAPFALQDGEPPEVRRERVRARVARHVLDEDRDRVGAFLGELLDAPFEDSAHPHLPAARRDAVIMNDQMRRAWEDFLGAELTIGPVVLILEDLHWGDAPTIRFVDSALRAHAGRPLYVLAFARPEVHELFPRLFADRGVEDVKLRELGKRAAEKLVTEVLGDRADAATVARLVERAGGNAFFLEELIRAVAEGREELPETILAMVQSRLASLEPDDRRVLRAASVFGEVFWPGAVAALVTEAIDRVRDRLGRLVDRELLVERPLPRFPGERELAFRHAYVHDASYGSLPAADRQAGHRLAAEWLEERGELDARVLAEHWERAGDRGRAVRWHHAAAAHALEGNDLAGTLASVERAIACGASGEEHGALLLLAAEARLWQGGVMEEARRGLTDAVERLARGGSAWCRGMGALALLVARLGSLDELHQVARAIAAVDDPPDPRAYTIAAARTASQLLIMSDREDGAALVARIDALVAGLQDDPVVTGWVSETHGFVAAAAADPSSALDLFRKASASFARAGDPRTANIVATNGGFALVDLGLYDEAVAEMGPLLAYAGEAGLGRVAAMAALNLGIALCRLGHLEEADAMLLRGELRASPWAETRALAYRACVQICAGDLVRAEELARAARERAGGRDRERFDLRGILGEVLLARGRPAEALALMAEPLVSHEVLMNAEDGVAGRLLVAAQAHEALGDVTQARRAIGEAHDLVVDLSGRVRDEGRRRSMLHNVPAYRRILELAQKLGAT